MKRIEIMSEELEFITDPSWTLTASDDESRKFGVMIEIMDMDNATGEPEFEEYPFIVSAEIMITNPHKSFSELDAGHKPNQTSLLYDCKSYMGGVPIDHWLTHAVSSSSEAKLGIENDDNFTTLAKEFNASEAKVVTSHPKFGTYAAQNGEGSELKYLQFRTIEAAQKYVDYLVKNRMPILGSMIGFILDRPINMIGDSGWDTIETQIKGR
jgi:hypothetical protein